MTPPPLDVGAGGHPLRYERLVWRGGLAALGACFVAGLAVVALEPMWAWLLPTAALLGWGLTALPRRVGTPLLVVLALFALVSGHSEGLQPQEVLFALVQAVYITWWFGTRLFVFDEPVLQDACDALMMAFLAYVPLSLFLTVLFGGDLASAATECLALSMLSLYFPIRELIQMDEGGLRLVVGVALAFGVVGAFRVLGSLRAALSDAEYAWQVAQGRVPMNEVLLYSASLLSLCLAGMTRRWRGRAILTFAFTVFTAGMIMTQWRAYYVGWAVAVGALMVWGSNRIRVTTLQVGALAAVVGGVLVVAVLGESVIIAVVGIAERIASIATANSSDVSLLNRYLEYEALWPVLLESPVLGHGPGVSFSFYDAIFQATWTKSYAHNTYLILWFKFGLVGLLLFVGVWGSTIWSTLRLSRSGRTALDRSVALYVAVALAGLTVSSIVAVTLVTDDTAFGFAVLFGLGAGLRARAQAPG